MLTKFPTNMNGPAKTPAANHLFNLNTETMKLPETTAQLFHHLVAKLLYLSRCMRQDIQTAVSFLCTRVQLPNEDDYKKYNAVPTLYKRTNADDRTRRQCTVVGRWLICSPSGNAKSQWHNDDAMKRGHILHIMQAEDQYQEFYRGRISGC